ncbi:MAG TPA: hypothetical protein VNJ02_15465 [Vicinamibacterales bacterium]|nr:hypothetical protein [Vicinamibacterales bacterium]
MLESSDASGDVDQQVQAQAMLANLLWVIGDAAGAWRYRVDAASRLEEVSSLGVASAVLVGNAGDAQASGHLRCVAIV